MDLPDQEPYIDQSYQVVAELRELPRKTIQSLLKEVQDPRVERNTLLSNGMAAGTFVMNYLRLIWLKKKEYI